MDCPGGFFTSKDCCKKCLIPDSSGPLRGHQHHKQPGVALEEQTYIAFILTGHIQNTVQFGLEQWPPGYQSVPQITAHTERRTEKRLRGGDWHENIQEKESMWVGALYVRDAMDV